MRNDDKVMTLIGVAIVMIFLGIWIFQSSVERETFGTNAIHQFN